MNNLKIRETELLAQLCKEQDLPLKMVKQLIKSAEQHSYENISATARKNEYLNMISFYLANSKGE
jgi:hypothetical protein